MTDSDLLGYCNEFFEYKAPTGDLFLKKKRHSKTKVGEQLRTTDSRGYYQVKIKGRLYLTHRLCWLIHYGSMPETEIDHINRNKTDNRIENLRLTERRGNVANTPSRRLNKVGARNISVEGNKFLVKVASKNVGTFYSLHAAINAANEARKNEYGTFAYFEDVSSFDEVDNTPPFTISGIKPEKFGEIKMLHSSGVRADEIASRLGISRAGVYRIIRFAETGVPVPDDVTTGRAAARLIL